MIFPPCNNVSPSIASRLIIAPRWWCLLPSPPPLLHLSCYLFVSFGRLWRCQQWPFIFPITWRWYWKLMTQALYVSSKKRLGKIAAPRDNISSRQRECAAAGWHGGLCPPHASPTLTSSSSKHLVCTRTWFVMAHGLRRASERRPVCRRGSGPKSPDPTVMPRGW